MASAGWERRNARARALGFESYYDYRAHNYGKRAPSEPRSTGDELARLRGHRADADLRTRLSRGDVELVSSAQTTRDPKTGRFTRVTVDVVDARGKTTRYTLKRLGKADREALAGALAAAGARIAGYLKRLLAEPADVDAGAEDEISLEREVA